ncbi:carbohydrate kinase [Chryseomicrobium sp. FSL W7-1435]|uniref:carbohydrate kinase family protein n=1 Tax=Chryseomicrobium sp. FSL W7-1435 TaxID=2921704 RepID=UPI00315A063E
MKIYSLGEVLIDFTPRQNEAAPLVPLYEQNPGGAPANVAVMAAKLGADSRLLAKVGQDMFGKFLIDYLTREKVDVSLVTTTQAVMTPLAFVSIGEDGDRDFAFYRTPGADTKLTIDDVSQAHFTADTILHIGTLSLTDEPSRSATYHALDLAQEAGSLISFDPNIRFSLWETKELVRDQIHQVLPFVDLVKLSEEELSFLWPDLSPEAACQELATTYGITLLIVTQGEKGCSYFRDDKLEYIEGFPANAIDTTGAGDAFWGTVLAGIAKTISTKLDLEKVHISRILREANAAGSLTVERRGGIPALPNTDEIHEVVQDN